MEPQAKPLAAHTLISLENTTIRTKVHLMRMAERMAGLPALWIHMHQTPEDMVERPLQLIHMPRTKEHIMVMGEEDMGLLLQHEVAQEEGALAEVMVLPRPQNSLHKVEGTVHRNKTHMLLMLALLVVRLDMVDLSQTASTRTIQIIHSAPSPHNHKDNTLPTLHVLSILDAATRIDLIQATITNKDVWHPRL